MADYITELRRLASSTSGDEVFLLNAWAGTTGKDPVTAANIACGTIGLDFPAALSVKAFGVAGRDPITALAAIPTPSSGTTVNVLAEYDASNAGSITSSSGAVSQWNDLSGNGYHLTQGTAANKPTTGTRTISSLNAIDFDGSNDRMVNASIPMSGAMTVLLVAAMDVPGDQPAWIDTPTFLREVLVVGTDGPTSEPGIYAGSSVPTGATPVITSTAAFQFTGIFNGASSLTRFNGAERGTGDAGTDGENGMTLAAFNDGSGAFNGLIAHLKIYSGVLTGATSPTLAAAEAALKSKWGTP